MRIFVAGLSKSGKSTNSRHAATVLSYIDYVSVSKLLRVRTHKLVGLFDSV
jgi:hypothetical protein